MYVDIIYKLRRCARSTTTTTNECSTSTCTASPVLPEEKQGVFVPSSVHRRFARNGNINDPDIEDCVGNADSQGDSSDNDSCDSDGNEIVGLVDSSDSEEESEEKESS